MIPAFQPSGLLPPGIHPASLQEVERRFGGTRHRKILLTGLRAALINLRDAGCKTAYVDGSFTTRKPYPNDWDGCWEEAGVNLAMVDPVLLQIKPPRIAQKIRYRGEMLPAHAPGGAGLSILEFFQSDYGVPKGIVSVDLASV